METTVKTEKVLTVYRQLVTKACAVPFL